MEITDGFGDEVAARYDDANASLFAPEVLDPQLDLLEELAGGSPVLELAIGTGRVGLPLARRGLAVTGIELSAAMVARLREKPGGDEASIPVVIGDMATARAPGAGSFGLVFLVFNTIMNLGSQEAQVACFENAAAHLVPGGHFLVEVAVPALRRLPPGQRFVAEDQSESHVGIDEYDVATQRQWSHHVNFLPDGRVRRASPPFRYVWPAELDLMARIAGMELVHRWGDWDRSPFTSESAKHVSVWRKLDLTA
ncbi:MAG TPA: class I SAM-dependent methyltransferase [Candidatus Limnocylindria bacterium]|jgi:SAM-dependent methyltransferase|nr:class I SAM-dependent methyltransferase [Candidatus Limnocylindria bacterium]